MEEKIEKKILFWAIVVILLVLSFLIVKAHFIPLISAFILAYLIRPVYLFLTKAMRAELAALLSILALILLLLIPLTLALAGIVTQTSESLSIKEFEQFKETLSSLPLISTLDLESFKSTLLSLLIQGISTTLRHIPSLLISTFIFLFSTYYILKDWDSIAHALTSFLPFKNKTRVAHELATTTNNIIYGYLLIALIDFISALTGFYLSGVKYFLLLPLLIAMVAFIPGIGAAIIWVPLALFYFITAQFPQALGVTITGLIISLLVDTFLATKLISTQSKIHPLIFLIGILGGIPLFGLFGLVIGPLILVITLDLIKESMG